MKKLIKNFIRSFGYDILSVPAIKLLESSDSISLQRNLMRLIYRSESASTLLDAYLESHSQIGQDLFVLSQLNFKSNGFFVELGATDGLEGSNTYLLEKKYGWKGIVAEPAICFHDSLTKNRCCMVERACVWSESGKSLRFHESKTGSLSTIKGFSQNDLHSRSRRDGKSYSVTTISLNDLLQKHCAPAMIDYLSVDTEGSECEVLSALNYERYRFSVITVEHNYGPYREAIFQLLRSKGYRRIYEEVSMFGDWYIIDG